MNHVIEHLPNLDQTMTVLSGLLKPGGRIVGQTPSADHVTARLFGTNWGPLHYLYHTIVFTPRGLRAAAPRWGLDVEKVAGAYMPKGRAMSAENVLKNLIGSKRRGRLPIFSLLFAASVLVLALDRLVNGDDMAVFDFVLQGSTA